ncbi:restriction endonuclease subunit S [Salipiger sp. PrR003]|uniref:restriction endonuclease subunit S n=1 Tax=Salipiger sp. PrR003 TaxID=2706776 RepID=UPI0013DD350C|nr:restriction endonuclease subunit S [Salipiger sp. PrR003]NDV52872.1 hypothetical protein [Salipiger sp. PrR003]
MKFDAHIFWAPQIAADWQWQRVAESFKVINGFPFESEHFNVNGVGFPLVRIRDILSTDLPTAYDGTNGLNCVVQNEDIVVGMDGDFNCAWWSKGNALLNQRVAALRAVPTGKLDPRFAFYQIPYGLKVINDLTPASTVKHLSSYDIAALRLPAPDLPTQKRIAAFLDRETARIDELIALRTRFEAKVKESREALIASLLVGLPEENQRPSTTNWLENLPSQVARERAKVHFQERVQLSETGDEELLTVSHLTGVTRRSEKNVNMIMAESHEGYKLVQPNDLVINTMWAWMGAMGVSKEAGLISPAYGIYRPTSGKLLPEYVDLLVRSKPFVAEATRRSKGIHSSRLRLYPDAFLDMRLPVPTLEQQDSILKQIEARATREDTLVEKNAKATELLREYRTALITAAVTGQIDVDTYGKAGTTSETLDRIEEEMQA